MNIGQRVMNGSRNVAAAVVLALMSACNSLPPLDDAMTVSLSTDFSAFGGLVVDVDGDPETRPGRMAAKGFQVAAMCEYCIILTPITVPLNAAIGAIITAAETLPEELAHELNRVSADVIGGLNLNTNFGKSMREEASRQGIVVRSKRVDGRLSVTMTDFLWDVGVGNNVAIRTRFLVTGYADGKSGYRYFTVTGRRAKVPEWIGDSGAQIRHELTSIMDEASQAIWQQVLNRDE